MTREEFKIIADALKTYYPRENFLPNPHALELWFQHLEDLDYRATEAALQKWVATNKWPPTIADIRESVTDVAGSRLPDWGSEWEKAHKLAGSLGFYRKEEALAQLNEAGRRAVNCIGWKSMCHDEDQTANRANFRMIYEAEAKRINERAQMSPKLLSIIDGMKAIEKGESA